MTTPAEDAPLLVRWLHCVATGGHDFSKGDTCPRCTAHKSDATLLDVIGHARVKKGNPYAQ